MAKIDEREGTFTGELPYLMLGSGQLLTPVATMTAKRVR